MRIYKGEIVSRGIAIGKIVQLQENDGNQAYIPLSSKEELERFHVAQKQTLFQIDELFEKTLKELGEEEAFIFESHKMMVQDLDFVEFVEEKIHQGNGAVPAVEEARDYFEMMFSQMEDEYMRARSLDIRDVTGQILRHLRGIQKEEIQEPSILVAKDLTPSQTLQLKRKYLLGFVTFEGSCDSHTAILTKTMKIPALVGITLNEDLNQRLAILDGEQGKFILDPDFQTLKFYENLCLQEEQNKQKLEAFRGKASITKAGKKIMLYANAGGLDDIQEAQKYDAEGIGLLRSEFLYLQGNDFPSEERQFEFYKNSLLAMKDKRVVVRTLDIGSDKQIDYFKLQKEQNPALGCRGIRLCFERIEIFKIQLKALLRASIYGKLSIMFPMIISLQEVQKIKELLCETKEELKKSQIPFEEEIELGIMIETPASALIAQDLAKEVNFLSIGTNDLMQYTLALDRQNSRLMGIRDPYHPALLKLIKMTIDAGHRENCWVGVCGEFAQEERAIEILIDMGIDELSVAPRGILEIRQKILEL